MRRISFGLTLAIAAMFGSVLQTVPGLSQAADEEARIYHEVVKLHPLGQHHEAAKKLETVKGALASLVITKEGALVSLSTRQLTPGNVYSLWFAVFNKTENCKATPCSISDFVDNAATEPDVGYADGLVAGADGTARFLAYIPKGKLKQNWYGNGFHNADNSEIHLVVHDHGKILPGMARMMMGSYRGGCTTESLYKGFPEISKSDGQPGPNTCNLIQVVFFVQGSE